MSCRACLVVRQIAYNAALAADLCLNTVLLGSPASAARSVLLGRALPGLGPPQSSVRS